MKQKKLYLVRVEYENAPFGRPRSGGGKNYWIITYNNDNWIKHKVLKEFFKDNLRDQRIISIRIYPQDGEVIVG